VLMSGDEDEVGTTTVCQTLMDYMSANNIALRAFDAGNSLNQFFPGITKRVDIRSTADQMSILDSLKHGEITLIDIPHGLILPTLHMLINIGFLDACVAGQVRLLNFYIYDRTLTDMTTYAEIRKITAKTKAKAKLILVQNARHFEALLAVNPKPDITIPTLDELSIRAAKSAKVSFLRFVANKTRDDQSANYSFVLRGYTRHWLATVWAEYDRLELCQVMNPRS
jgi:hypothetical protein